MKSFATLTSVIIVGSVGAAIAVSLILIGTDAYRTTASVEEFYKAKALTDTCAEQALDSIRLDINYQGNETVELGGGTCAIRPVIGAGSETPTVRVEGNFNSAVRKAQITLTHVTPQITIGSWQEVADF